MGVWTAPTAQEVTEGNNVLFTTSNNCGCSVSHRTGSGLFTLHGNRKYRLSFGANVAGDTAETELDLVFTINGEPIPATLMSSTPATADTYNNVGRSICISVPCGCCYNIAIRNAGTTAVTVRDAYLCIEKEC